MRLADGTLLNRYWDDRDTPREEHFARTWKPHARPAGPHAEVYRNLRAAAESGWDFSSRWLADGRTLDTIRTVEIAPGRPELSHVQPRGPRSRGAYRATGDTADSWRMAATRA